MKTVTVVMNGMVAKLGDNPAANVHDRMFVAQVVGLGRQFRGETQ